MMISTTQPVWAMRRAHAAVGAALLSLTTVAMLCWGSVPAHAAPAPSGVVATVSAASDGRCVTTVTWQAGKGNIYIVQKLVDTDVGPDAFGIHAAKVPTSGDPQGSEQYQYTWPENPSGFGAGQYRDDVTVYSAKGRDGAHGDLLAVTSSESTVYCS
jgi:hypothetical protein